MLSLHRNHHLILAAVKFSAANCNIYSKTYKSIQAGHHKLAQIDITRRNLHSHRSILFSQSAAHDSNNSNGNNQSKETCKENEANSNPDKAGGSTATSTNSTASTAAAEPAQFPAPVKPFVPPTKPEKSEPSKEISKEAASAPGAVQPPSQQQLQQPQPEQRIQPPSEEKLNPPPAQAKSEEIMAKQAKIEKELEIFGKVEGKKAAAVDPMKSAGPEHFIPPKPKGPPAATETPTILSPAQGPGMGQQQPQEPIISAQKPVIVPAEAKPAGSEPFSDNSGPPCRDLVICSGALVHSQWPGGGEEWSWRGNWRDYFSYENLKLQLLIWLDRVNFWWKEARAIIQTHPLFSYWPHIGYLISASATLVTDIVWLRSLLICANFFGLAVNYSFAPPFWTGIYWNFFFIAANLIQIIRVLMERREIELTAEEQLIYRQQFDEAFSTMEFRKLLRAGKFVDLLPGEVLMKQGQEINKVYMIVGGKAKVEREFKVFQQTSQESEEFPDKLAQDSKETQELGEIPIKIAENDPAKVVANIEMIGINEESEEISPEERRKQPGPSSKEIPTKSAEETAPALATSAAPQITTAESSSLADFHPVDSLPASPSLSQVVATVISDAANSLPPSGAELIMSAGAAAAAGGEVLSLADASKLPKKYRSIMERQFGAVKQGALGHSEFGTENGAGKVENRKNYRLEHELIGEVASGSLIGELSVSSSSTADQIASSTITVTAPTRVLLWEKGTLRALFWKFPILAIGWYSVVSSDLSDRLKQQEKLSSDNAYRYLIMGAISGGNINSLQRTAIERYRIEHHLSEEQHLQALAANGWTKADWLRGTKKVGWLEAISSRITTASTANQQEIGANNRKNPADTSAHQKSPAAPPSIASNTSNKFSASFTIPARPANNHSTSVFPEI
jgi:CRP-like cAMP-binding protein